MPRYLQRIVIACESVLAVAVLLTSSVAAQQGNAKEPADAPPDPAQQIVDRALNWLSRHQNPDGGWGLASFPHLCKDVSCLEGLNKRGNQNTSDIAATAMAVLPFLAAGQTHKTKGPYQKTVYGGLYWLLKTEKSDGDLRGNGNMYCHGIATIALCEAYGQSSDRQLGAAAQMAVNFIQKAQCEADGGWNATPQGSGQTSITGWQVLALAFAKRANLQVESQVAENAKKWFAKVESPHGTFGETEPGNDLGTTAIGTLCTRILGTAKEPTVAMQALMDVLPDKSPPGSQRWFLIANLARFFDTPEAAKWRARLVSALASTQESEQCAAGSWDPTKDPHAESGGRVTITSFNALTLLAGRGKLLKLDPSSEEPSN